MTFIQDFKKFIARGNLMDLAVGIMIGAAFNSLVQSFVKDIFTPLIGIFLGKTDLGKWSATFSVPNIIGQPEPQVVILPYGKFLQAGLDFLILSLIIFTIIKMLARLKAKAENEKNTEVPTPKDIQLLSEIRDSLVKISQQSNIQGKTE